MIFLFFLSLIFAAPIAEYNLDNATAYNFKIEGSKILLVASNGLHVLYQNGSLYHFYESPAIITGPAVFYPNYIIAPAGDKLVFFTIKGMGYESFTKPAPAILRYIYRKNGTNWGFNIDRGKLYIYTLGTNFSSILNETLYRGGSKSDIKLREFPGGFLIYNTYQNKLKNISILTTDTIYPLSILPKGPITFNETHFLIPWNEHLYVISFNNAFYDDIRMKTTVYGATFYDGKLYVHTYNESSGMPMENPIWINAIKSGDMWFIEGVNKTYLYKDIIKGGYNFKGKQIQLYRPLNIFYVLTDKSLEIYTAPSCYFNKRVYLMYCKPINISGSYFISKPTIVIDNKTLPGDLKNNIEINPREYSYGEHTLKCLSSFGNYREITDTVRIVRTSQGPLDELNITVQPLEVKEGELIYVSVYDMDGNPTNAILKVDGKGYNVKGNTTLNLTPGMHSLNFTKTCYKPFSVSVLVKEKSQLGNYIRIGLGLVLLAIVGLLAYLKFVKKAI